MVENAEWRVNDSFQANPGPAEPNNVMLDWQGIRIPIPAIYTSSPISAGSPEINGAPILAKLRVMRLMGAGPESPVKLPTPVLFYVVEYHGGLQAWMDNLYAPNIDRAQFKIETRTVARLPALRYDPGDPDDMDPVEHVVELAPDKLLLISSDQTYPEHQQIIDGIVRQ